MNSFSIDKQRDQVNAEWMSRPVDDRQPLALVLISMEQSLTFAYRLKRKLLNGPIFGGAYMEKKLRLGIAGGFKFRIDPEAVTRNLKLEIPEIRRVNRRRDSEAPRTGLR